MPSALAMEAVTGPPSAVRSLRASPLYRGATIALFLSGVGVSAAAPQMTLFMVNDLHVSLTTAGLYYLTNITAPLAGYLVGARSDRSGKRLGLFRVCAALGFLGWIGMAVADQAWMPFVISTVVLAFSGAAGSQLFTAVHDDLKANANPVSDGVISIVRMALTAGWIVGPVLGTLLDTAAGPRVLLAATGLCTLAQIVPMGFARTEQATAAADCTSTSISSPISTTTAEHEHERLEPRPTPRVMLPMLTFTGLCVLVYAGEPIRYGYLPLYMRDGLHLSTAFSGAAIGLQPLIELMLMPLTIVLARRIGMMQLMIFGAALGIGANLCFALTGSATGMLAGQILMGGVWGVFANLGIIIAQRLLPQAVATASAIYVSAEAIAAALGGLTGGFGVSLLGIPHVFLAPALYSLIATVGVAIMSRSRHAVR